MLVMFGAICVQNTPEGLKGAIVDGSLAIWNPKLRRPGNDIPDVVVNAGLLPDTADYHANIFEDIFRSLCEKVMI